MINYDDLLNYCRKLKITPNQFNFCYLIYIKDWTNLKSLSQTVYIDASGQNRSLAIKKSEVEDLVKRGFVIDLYEGERYNTSYVVTEKFAKYLFIDEEDAGNDLWNNYFDYFTIGGIYQSAKTADKDRLMEVYLKKIRRNKKKHREVMEMLSEYKTLVKQGKMQPMGIEKFVMGENWEVVKKIVTKTGENWDDSL